MWKLLGEDSVSLLKGREKAVLCSFCLPLSAPCVVYGNGTWAAATTQDDAKSNEEEKQMVEQQVEGAWVSVNTAWL